MRSQPRYFLQWVAINAGVIAAILVSAEALWRWGTSQTSDARHTREFIGSSLDLLEPCAAVEMRDGVRTLVGQHRQNTAGDFVYPLDRAPESIRIAIVGESTGVMLGGALHGLLQEPARREQVQVLNCAASGAAFEHVVRRAQEVLAYRPDALMVVFGHNLTMHYPSNPWVLWLHRLLHHSRLAASLLTWSTPQSAPPDPHERLRLFETWLRQFAQRARAEGVNLIVTTVTPNLFYPPALSSNAASTPELLAATLAQANGDLNGAARILAAASAQLRDAYIEFTLGALLARMGQPQLAATHLQAAIDLPQAEPDRAPSAVNQMIRRVAQQEGILLRDTEAETQSASRLGLPGWDVMRDHCHLQYEYLVREATALLSLAFSAARPHHSIDAPTAVPQGAGGVGSAFDGLVRIQAGRDDDAAAFRHLRAVASLVEHWARTHPARLATTIDAFIASSAPLGTPPTRRRAELLVNIADGYWAAGFTERARMINTIARQDHSAAAWVQLGLFELSAGDGGTAADAFRHALQIAPDRPDAAFFLVHLDGSPATSSPRVSPPAPDPK